MTQSPRIQAVVFDLDGLMLNTEDIFELAGQQLMARRGMEMTDELRRGMLGRRPIEAFTVFREMTGLPDTIEELMMETKTLFEAIAVHHLGPMPGLISLLQLIDSKQLPRAVATSSPRAYMETLLGRMQLLSGFRFTLTAEDVTHGKPNPEIYLKAAEKLGVDPGNMLVLEDSETGTRAAAEAGAFVVSVPNRHTDWGDFTRSNMCVGSLEDVALRRLILEQS
ncbi:MAG: HAD family phosphatase [Planctomycetaceae bacterium]